MSHLLAIPFDLPADADPMARAAARKDLRSQMSNIRRIHSAADIIL
ncbi:MAG TPA: hypothetical protein PK669_09520 [Methanosarcina thermophila]|nr:hypothetical protein [Methanosarcina thermophila]HOA69371.1 hypothetical protein [Methanosarcina thermophila]HOQ65519.1 hypothetical protein [Methanosarcina thermophila]HPT81106.1 hypothetical protein [Methanosarcina thermophila]HPZ20527.1 hypothetical protein [Methanosarcina thermophila]HQD94917.1 hypothetical protein [Methanosarcina thermophila]